MDDHAMLERPQASRGIIRKEFCPSVEWGFLQAGIRDPKG